MHTFISAASAALWGAPMAALLAGAGVFLSIRCGFVQLRHFPEAMRRTLGGIFSREGAGKGAVTPLQAVCSALAGTVGTGNIAGVALAIALGGPGTLFWLWLTAILGMATKFAEVTLAVRFRERGADGQWLGGPMYTIKNGLGRRFMPLASAFALFGTLAAFGMGSAVQGAEIAGAARTLSMELLPGLPAERRLFALAAGVLVAFIAFYVLSGGMGRLGRVCELLVPLMGVIYILACLAVIAANAGALPGVFRDIFVSAFEPEAVCGGVGLRACIGWGVRRGVFSNEAGLGSAPIAHASSSETDPVRQGFFGIFEVFADTIVVCTLTALAILCSGVAIPYGSPATLSVCVSAFAGVFGGGAAAAILSACMLLFSLSSLLGWGIYGLRCCGFLLGKRSERGFVLLYALSAVLGAAGTRSMIWELADILNALMALPNLISLFLLSGEVSRLTRDYFSQRQRENISRTSSKPRGITLGKDFLPSSVQRRLIYSAFSAVRPKSDRRSGIPRLRKYSRVASMPFSAPLTPHIFSA